MKRNLTIYIQSNQEQAYEATKHYFLSQGFVLSENSKASLVFSKGNTLQNMVTFNPLKWKSSISITFDSDKIVAVFDIDTTFQTVTLKEEQLWERFIENYKISIVQGFDFQTINKKLITETKKDSLKYVMAAFVGGLGGVVVGGILAYFTGFLNLVTICAIVGATTLMFYKIEKDKKARNAI